MAINMNEGTSSEARLVRTETIIENINYMLQRIDKRFDLLESKIENLGKKLNDKIDNVETKLDPKIDSSVARLETKADINLKWLIGMMITLFILNGFVPAISKTITGILSK